VEDIIDPLCHREPQLIHHRRDLLDDLEGSVSFGLELCLLMVEF
jgi:hypothetical protein